MFTFQPYLDVSKDIDCSIYSIPWRYRTPFTFPSQEASTALDTPSLRFANSCFLTSFFALVSSIRLHGGFTTVIHVSFQNILHDFLSLSPPQPAVYKTSFEENPRVATKATLIKDTEVYTTIATCVKERKEGAQSMKIRRTSEDLSLYTEGAPSQHHSAHTSDVQPSRRDTGSCHRFTR